MSDDARRAAWVEANVHSTDVASSDARLLSRRQAVVTLDRLVVIGICGLFLWLAIETARTKLPWEDEGWFASPAVNLVTNGQMGTPILASSEALRQGLDRYTYWIPPLYLVAQAGWYKLVGFSLLTMRALSIVWGLLALAAWFAIVRALSGSARVASLALLLLVIDPTFVGRAAEGRMDMMAAALGASGIAAYLHLRESRLTLAVVTGHALVVLSGLTHPCGALYFAALVLVTFVLDRTRLTWRHLLVAGGPYLVGAAGWGLYVSHEPALFLDQFQKNASGRFRGVLAPLGAIKAEIVERYLTSYGIGNHWAGPLAGLRALVLVAYVVAIGAIAWSRTLRERTGVRLLLWLTAMTFGLMTFLEGHKYHLYLVHILPLLAALTAVAIVFLRPRRLLAAGALWLGVAAVLAVQLGGAAYGVVRDRYHRDYVPAVAYLAREADGRVVTGTAELAFGLGFDGRVRDDITLGYPSGHVPEIVVVNARYTEYWRRHPAIGDHARRLLHADYRRVYAEGGYEIYARPR